jgi:hypothetical protein
MKKIIGTFSLALIIGNFISCSGKKEEVVINAPEGMNILDLTSFGKPFVIFVPDTSTAKLQIIQQSYGPLDIVVGNNFAISINEQAADIELKRKDIKEDEVNRFRSFVVDEPSAILWESQIVSPEYHFLMNVKVGDRDYSLEDIKNTDAEPFGREAIQKMFDSAKNIKEKKKDSNAS